MASKSDYLKKYISDDATQKKKKKKKPKTINPRMRIIDPEADLHVPSPAQQEEESDEEDKPDLSLAGASVDELRLMGKFKADTWTTVDDKTNNSRTRHDSESSDGSDQSPARDRHDSDADLSPVRAEVGDNDLSPPRRKGADDDMSPPRQKAPDLSPVRQKKGDDLSPPRRKIKQEPDSTPPRRRRRDDSNDSSPPRRKRRRSSDRDNGRVKREPGAPEVERKTLDGKSVGLQSAKSLREEGQKLRNREERHFRDIDESLSGRDAETIVRDRKTGRRRDLGEEKKEKEAKERKQKELEEKYKTWNKGVKQVSQRETQLQEMADVASKPFARYRDDEDLDTHLKAKEMKDDPMHAYFEKKKQALEKRSGYVYPKYQGPMPPPNRYGIMPGYRWDGVNRSNGFENKLQSHGNIRKAEQEEEYKWRMGSYE